MQHPGADYDKCSLKTYFGGDKELRDLVETQRSKADTCGGSSRTSEQEQPFCRETK